MTEGTQEESMALKAFDLLKTLNLMDQKHQPKISDWSGQLSDAVDGKKAFDTLAEELSSLIDRKTEKGDELLEVLAELSKTSPRPTAEGVITLGEFSATLKNLAVIITDNQRRNHERVPEGESLFSSEDERTLKSLSEFLNLDELSESATEVHGKAIEISQARNVQTSKEAQTSTLEAVQERQGEVAAAAGKA